LGQWANPILNNQSIFITLTSSNLCSYNLFPLAPLLTDERRFFSRVLKNAQMQGSRGAFHLRQAGNPEK